MTNTKFKLGDTVVRIGTEFYGGNATASVGQMATVVHNDGRFSEDAVVVEFHRADGKLVTQGWAPKNVDLVDSSSVSAPNLKWTEISVESSRRYTFPDGSRVTIDNVVRLCVRPSGHRLETADSKKYIVPGKFTLIEICAKEWSA